ncbi:Tumor protein D54 [Holothuria leucospilota]|uniref:Tumor protein D54 n=1 Tax=Holothuria leucospilota TaxID=206669 RepID=A0A9Q0YL56_HOLLE|nr:Tumor protein D54 [Holothuria leucospilota]
MAPLCDAASQTDFILCDDKIALQNNAKRRNFLPLVEFDFESNLAQKHSKRSNLRILWLKMYSHAKDLIRSDNNQKNAQTAKDSGNEEDDDWDFDDGYSATERLNSAPKYQTYLTLVDVDSFEEEEPLSSPETSFVDTTPTDTPKDLESPSGAPPSTLTDEEREELQKELDELNNDIEALRQTLHSKETTLKEIKRKLGITPMGEFTNKARQSWGSVQQSQAYQTTSGKLKEWNEAIVSSETYNKTKTGLQTAGQKTGAAFTSFGSAVSRKLGEVRGSNAFKSFEEKVSTAATSVKSN